MCVCFCVVVVFCFFSRKVICFELLPFTYMTVIKMSRSLVLLGVLKLGQLIEKEE